MQRSGIEGQWLGFMPSSDYLYFQAGAKKYIAANLSSK
jgi:hypothetical protein